MIDYCASLKARVAGAIGKVLKAEAKPVDVVQNYQRCNVKI
jgi:hypothetical protein